MCGMAYQYGPAGPAGQPGPFGQFRPAQVDPRAVRPSRLWYAIAGVIVAVTLLAGCGLLVVAFRTAGSFEDLMLEPVIEFDAGQPATVQLSAAKRWAIFVNDPAADASPDASPGASAGPSRGASASPSASPSARRTGARCTATAVAGGTITLTPDAGTTTVSDGVRSWELLYLVDVTQDGEYRVTCEPVDADRAPAVRYGVGEDPDIGGLIARMLAVFGAGFGTFLVPCAGVCLAALIALITAIRRHNHRRRLLYGG
jgi:hypothetical protein